MFLTRVCRIYSHLLVPKCSLEHSAFVLFFPCFTYYWTTQSHYQKPEINVTNDRGQPEGASGNSPAPAKYDELGTGGGRPGPRDHTSPSNYAQAKQEDDYSAGEQSEYSDNDNEDNLVSDSIIV